MSKSVLVIDTPEKCLNCPLGNSEESDGEEVYCNVLQCITYQKGLYEDEGEEELYNSKKPDWCPLKEMPEKRHHDLPDCRLKVYDSGWNDCIDEILKSGGVE